MAKEYDSSWDSDEETESFDRKMDEWEKRDWGAWLKSALTFPFKAKREDDTDEAFFTDVAGRDPFRLGHKMDVIGLDDDEDVDVGFLVNVREGKHAGQAPLADLEVTPKSDKNYWPVREYAVWFANRSF